jgi:hypothetical protein
MVKRFVTLKKRQNKWFGSNEDGIQKWKQLGCQSEYWNEYFTQMNWKFLSREEFYLDFFLNETCKVSSNNYRYFIMSDKYLLLNIFTCLMHNITWIQNNQILSPMRQNIRCLWKFQSQVFKKLGDWEQRSSAILRSESWSFLTNFSGQRVGPILRVQESKSIQKRR